jgi:hypothetical protein
MRQTSCRKRSSRATFANPQSSYAIYSLNSSRSEPARVPPQKYPYIADQGRLAADRVDVDFHGVLLSCGRSRIVGDVTPQQLGKSMTRDADHGGSQRTAEIDDPELRAYVVSKLSPTLQKALEIQAAMQSAARKPAGLAS